MFEFEFERSFQSCEGWADFLKRNILLSVAIVVVYLYSIYMGTIWMKNRPPYQLKVFSQFWNFSLFLFSLFGSIRVVPPFLHLLFRHGFHYTVCASPLEGFGNGSCGLWLLMFILSKTPDLVDTWVLVLRKKPVMLLHWYHHSTVLFFCWYCWAVLYPCGLWFAAMNLAVHTVMYFYYFLASMASTPSWGILVTLLQISQMIAGLLIQLMVLSYFWDGGHNITLSAIWNSLNPNYSYNYPLDYSPTSCNADIGPIIIGILIYLSYLILFVHFFVKRYFRSRNKSLGSGPKED